MAVPLFDRIFRVVLCTVGWLLILAAFGLAGLMTGLGVGLGNCTDVPATGAMAAVVIAPALLLGIAAAVRLWPRARKWRGAAVIVGLYVVWAAAVTGLMAYNCSRL